MHPLNMEYMSYSNIVCYKKLFSFVFPAVENVSSAVTTGKLSLICVHTVIDASIEHHILFLIIETQYICFHPLAILFCCRK